MGVIYIISIIAATVIAIILAFALLKCVKILSGTVEDFMKLLNEINKRQVSTIADILENIDLSAPNTGGIISDNKVIEDILDETDGESNYFNPHEYDVEAHKDEIV